MSASEQVQAISGRPARISWSPLLIITLGGALGLLLRFHQVQPTSGPDFNVIPYTLGKYQGEERVFNDETYEILRAQASTLRKYVDADGTVYWLFIAYFREQKYGAQIHSPRHCLPGGGWRIGSTSDVTVPFGSQQRAATQLMIERDDSRQLMDYWFETRSGAIHGEFALKFDLVRNALMFKPTDAVFVRLTVWRPDFNMQAANENAQNFLSVFGDSIRESLPFHK